MSSFSSGESFDELERAVRAANPAAFLVLPRILRRVIKHDRMLTGFGLRVPHRKCFVIEREPLLEIVDKAELGLTEDAELPERVLLLAKPNPRKLAALPAEDLLLGCWRLLFHASIHAVLEERADRDLLSPAEIRRRIHQLGTAEFEEIRMVLGQEDMLLPPRSDASIYEEFAAVYLELRYFAGSFLQRYFPGLESLAAVDALIEQDVDAERLFRATRPQGAPDPQDPYVLMDFVNLPADVGSDSLPSPDQPSVGARRGAGGEGSASSYTDNPLANSPHPSPLPKGEGTNNVALPKGEGTEKTSESKYRSLMRKSQRPASLGNVVRAAIYRARAEQCAPPAYVDRVRSAIKMDVSRLVRRLKAALELEDSGPEAWQEPLFTLVREAPRGIWTAEAKLLFDLQKVCVDHEREIFTVDLVEWVLSWGRRPLKRQLPDQRDVLMLKHLRSAARRLGAVRLSDRQRGQLASLIQTARHRVEARLRSQLHPQITAALDDVGLVAQNLPERVARKKLIEELLDHVEEHGFLTMSGLRDAISRNQLKLPDLSEPLGFLHGDQLLRADRKLALALDGVYRRGEFYMRWMQRISSLAFGTRVGRFLTRFAAVPFGGAYVALAGVHHVWELIAGAHPPPGSESAYTDGLSHGIAAEGFRLTSPAVVMTLGLFLLCLINSEAFRRAISLFCKKSFRVFRAVVIDPIRWILQSPLLQRILHSRLFSFLLRYVLKPLIWTALAWMLLPEESRKTSAEAALVIFLAVNLLLNSRPGRIIEEVIADWIVQSWHRFGLRVITGLFWWVVDVFKWLLTTIERLMYSVDEWLRFKSGEGRLTLAAKAGMGVVWFFIAYVLRFCVNVLIEPQINPIKHFPVVTVSHKLLLPLIPSFAGVLELTMEKALAWTVAATTIWSIPGIFGFLVWELTENWRLYAANRKPILSPTPIGAHGETMSRLLKTGFHSGTLPKRYAKLRRAERRARINGNWRPVRKHLQIIHDVEVAMRRFVEREFLELFVESVGRQAPAITLKSVTLGTNNVRLTFGSIDVAAADLRIALEVESGWLVAGVVQSGWSNQLATGQRHLLTTAMLGLYKTAGVELARQQIEDQFARPTPWYEITPAGLILWPEGAEDVEVLYDLRENAWIAPQSIRGLARWSLPTVARRQLVFADVPIAWNDWVMIWSHVSVDRNRPPEPIASVCVLPRG